MEGQGGPALQVRLRPLRGGDRQGHHGLRGAQGRRAPQDTPAGGRPRRRRGRDRDHGQGGGEPGRPDLGAVRRGRDGRTAGRPSLQGGQGFAPGRLEAGGRRLAACGAQAGPRGSGRPGQGRPAAFLASCPRPGRRTWSRHPLAERFGSRRPGGQAGRRGRARGSRPGAPGRDGSCRPGRRSKPSAWNP